MKPHNYHLNHFILFLCTSHTDPYLICIFISNLEVLGNCIDLVTSTV